VVRYPDANVHIDHRLLLAVEEAVPEPATARWDQEVIHDADGTATVCCLTEDGQPVALLLDEELTEALAGALLDTEDGEEVDGAPTYRDGVADALAAAAREVEHATDASPATLAAAIRMMGTAGPLAQDGPVRVHEDGEQVPGTPSELPAAADLAAHIAELEITAERLRHDLDVARAAADPQKIDAVGSLVARTTSLVRIERNDARARATALEERLATVRSVLAVWEHRTHYGDSAVAPLLRDLQAVVSDRPATEEARRG
jgi:hypothetical protein